MKSQYRYEEGGREGEKREGGCPTTTLAASTSSFIYSIVIIISRGMKGGINGEGGNKD